MKPLKTKIGKTIRFSLGKYDYEVISIEKTFRGEINIKEENEKLNQELAGLKENDPDWLSNPQYKLPNLEEKNK